jgi:hypothetical protein
LIILTFSNSAVAVSPIFEARCKIEYTQLDLITGTETIYKNTSQFEVRDYCEEGLKRLTPKVDKWIDKNNTNLITKINEFKCKLKNTARHLLLNKLLNWNTYRDCKTYIQKFSAYLVDKYPKQIGAKVYQNSIAD